MFGFNKYHYSYIYKIVCLDPNIDDFYIGSTISLSNRCNSHMRNSVNKKKTIYHVKLYQFIRDSGGYENWEMQVIKLYKCEIKIELLKEEQKYINELKPSLNSCNSYTTIEEEKKRAKKYTDDNQIKKKQWYQDNKKIQQEKNTKRYNERYKEKRDKKIECECGSVIREYEIMRHKKTKKHQAYLNTLST